MCGIVGFAGENQQKIDKMVELLVHRGPDGHATSVQKGGSLGHARLAILDPRPEGDQPMWNANKTIGIVFNGEIWNYKQLSEQENLRCKTHTDTEVLLLLYEKYGMKFVSQLRGMFAFAIYDTRDQSWHLARDPSGIKPLYICTVNNMLHFASETQSLTHVLPKKPDINLHALSAYLQLQYVPGPSTLCEGITSVPPGTVLHWKNGRQSEEIVLPELTTSENWKPKSKAQFRREFPEYMQKVVEDHLIADKPLGLFLSGGMDSTILLHHMATVSSKPVRTFTVRFQMEPGWERFNKDAELAALSAKHYGTNHEEILLTAEQYRDLYRETAIALYSPNANTIAPVWHAMSKAAKQSVDVALCGSGGDELFGGSHRYRAAYILQKLHLLPPALRGQIGKFAGYPPDVFAMKVRSPAFAHRFMAQGAKGMQELVKGDWFVPHAALDVLTAAYPQKEKSPVRALMECERATWLVDESLRLTDATTMATGLECRVPFLDPRIIAASHATPAEWHVSMRNTKVLLKETYKPILPPHTFSLGKASFVSPVSQWLREACGTLAEEMLESRALPQYFNMNAVRTVVEKHVQGEQYALQTIMRLVQLHYWFETVYR